MSFPVDVIFAHPDCGWPGEAEKALQGGLEPGKAYTIRKVEVHQSDTRIWLADHVNPPMGYSSVLFEPAPEARDPDDPCVEADTTMMTRQEVSEIRSMIGELEHQGSRLFEYALTLERGAVVRDLNRVMHVVRKARGQLEKNWEKEQDDDGQPADVRA
jgi:hypothetical protein